MDKTHLDEIVDYPSLIIKELEKNNNFVSLLTNSVNADMNDKEVELLWEECISDHEYIPKTVQTGRSFCCIDTIVSGISNQLKTMIITILVGVDEDMMSLKGTEFKGVRGNRRDNLVREIDYSLKCSKGIFGIGNLDLREIKPVIIDTREFACKKMIYEVTNFSKSYNIERER